jgi:hypothetical protein
MNNPNENHERTVERQQQIHLNCWCPVCNEIVNNLNNSTPLVPTTICWICGATLLPNPSDRFDDSINSSHSGSNDNDDDNNNDIDHTNDRISGNTTAVVPNNTSQLEILANIRRQRQDLSIEQARLLQEVRALRQLVAQTRQSIRLVRSGANQTATIASWIARNNNRNNNNSNDDNGDINSLLEMDGDHWEAIPIDLLDPQGATTAASSNVWNRPVAKEVLASLPRTVLTPHSVLFHDATLSMWNPTIRSANFTRSVVSSTSAEVDHDAESHVASTWTETAIPGEFGPTISETFSVRDVPLFVVSPLTGRDNGQLDDAFVKRLLVAAHNARDDVVVNDKSKDCNAAAPKEENVVSQPMPCIVYMERGDNITFVQKAINICRAVQKMSKNQWSVMAVVIGNDKAQPWPYIMRDSTNEATQFNLQVPVVMVSQSCGRRIKQQQMRNINSDTDSCYPYWHCTLTIHGTISAINTTVPNNKRNKNECVICCEEYIPGQTVLRIPYCGHVFHEACALPWLSQQHTCPTCRRILPTDDINYNNEQRRTSQTHATGNAANTSNVNNQAERSDWNDFYG